METKSFSFAKSATLPILVCSIGMALAHVKDASQTVVFTFLATCAALMLLTASMYKLLSAVGRQTKLTLSTYRLIGANHLLYAAGYAVTAVLWSTHSVWTMTSFYVIFALVHGMRAGGVYEYADMLSDYREFQARQGNATNIK